jgi:hypothetical protein
MSKLSTSSQHLLRLADTTVRCLGVKPQEDATPIDLDLAALIDKVPALAEVLDVGDFAAFCDTL